MLIKFKPATLVNVEIDKSDMLVMRSEDWKRYVSPRMPAIKVVVE